MDTGRSTLERPATWKVVWQFPRKAKIHMSYAPAFGSSPRPARHECGPHKALAVTTHGSSTCGSPKPQSFLGHRLLLSQLSHELRSVHGKEEAEDTQVKPSRHSSLLEQWAQQALVPPGTAAAGGSWEQVTFTIWVMGMLGLELLQLCTLHSAVCQ